MAPPMIAAPAPAPCTTQHTHLVSSLWRSRLTAQKMHLPSNRTRAKADERRLETAGHRQSFDRACERDSVAVLKGVQGGSCLTPPQVLAGGA